MTTFFQKCGNTFKSTRKTRTRFEMSSPSLSLQIPPQTLSTSYLSASPPQRPTRRFPAASTRRARRRPERPPLAALLARISQFLRKTIHFHPPMSWEIMSSAQRQHINVAPLAALYIRPPPIHTTSTSRNGLVPSPSHSFPTTTAVLRTTSTFLSPSCFPQQD